MLAAADDNYAATKQKLSEYFSPEKKKHSVPSICLQEMHTRTKRKSRHHTRLRMLAKNCEFADVDA